ncbi:hypothetical protein GCM10011369_12800 [Neiella marina]|uniref:Transglycosylase SLT domain-containing protein n=1 Tax=Neiella marina TaxID=508461 RepID=A0A8J2XNY9_9GAMM|nr:hypothetical protein [Neiella marina]GGA72475.1 hypothetical protein GCM10011369_12800 [Neiella marina]
MKKNKLKQVVVTICLLSMTACSTTPPANPDNLCDIFREKDDWYDDAVSMNEKWGVPIQIPMAMMYQESSFRHDALPPRDYIFFGLIPWGRVSSAYGYSQAKTMTWKDYIRETGNSGADRDDFGDAIDFMGWFITKTHKINGVSRWDAYGQYLNYHEGWGGYRRKTYNAKPWLKKVAKKVEQRASKYGTQYRKCKDELEGGFFDWLF